MAGCPGFLKGWLSLHGIKRTSLCLAVALNSTGTPAEAMALLEKAHRQHPADRGLLMALVSIARDIGDLRTALWHARELAAFYPSARGFASCSWISRSTEDRPFCFPSRARGAGLLGLARIVGRVEVGHSDRSHAAQLDYRVLVGPLIMVHALRKVQITAGVQPLTPSRIELVAHPQVHGPDSTVTS